MMKPMMMMMMMMMMVIVMVMVMMMMMMMMQMYRAWCRKFSCCEGCGDVDDVCQVDEIKSEEIGRTLLGKQLSQELSGLLAPYRSYHCKHFWKGGFLEMIAPRSQSLE